MFRRFGRRAPGKRAFTLIELLVVIAIVAILAAILFPVFAQARHKARQTTCLSGLKQYGNAFQMYLQDWDGGFTGLWQYQPLPGNTRPWSWMLIPYVKENRLQQCPETQNRFTDLWDISYGYNSYYLGYGNSTPPIPREAQIGRPSQTVLLADTYSGSAPPRHRTGYYNMNPPNFLNQYGPPNWWLPDYVKGFETWGRITRRHSGGTVVLWCDGHVAWMPVPGAITHDETLWDLQ